MREGVFVLEGETHQASLETPLLCPQRRVPPQKVAALVGLYSKHETRFVGQIRRPNVVPPRAEGLFEPKRIQCGAASKLKLQILTRGDNCLEKRNREVGGNVEFPAQFSRV